MTDKSPRQSMSKTSSKSIKEKRIERKTKAGSPIQAEQLTHGKKR